MSKVLKVKFVDFPANDMRDITMPILEKNFECVEESDNPDFVFYSVFGYEHLKYDCVRIFWTGENLQPDFNVCDYAIGFGHMNFEDRYRRIPLYYFYDLDYERAINKHLISEEEILKKDRFCNFIYSNGNAEAPREEFFKLLSKYKRVDSAGRFMNNVGEPIEDKFEFQRNYKFSIAFENSSSSGYTTEKILQAFAAGTIPIYWGNPRVAEDFNQNAFINCHAFNSFEDVVNKVMEIDKDDEVFRTYLRQPIGDSKQFPQNPLQEYEDYLIYICSQEPNNAMRRNNVFWGKRYQDELKSLRIQNGRSSLSTRVYRYIGKVADKILGEQA